MAVRSTTWILNFHGIGRIERPFDPGEAVVWINTDHFTAILDSIPDQAGFGLSFDDGNRSDVEIALPALTKRSMKASFYIPVGKLGEPGFLDESDLRALVNAGMTVGSHGWSHQSWRNLSPTDMDRETKESKKMLEAITRSPVLAAACPFGAYDRSVLRALREAEYQQVFTSDRGPAIAHQFLNARNTVYTSRGPEEILAEHDHFRNSWARRVRLAYKRSR